MKRQRKYPPSYARIARMSGAELLRQLSLPQNNAEMRRNEEGVPMGCNFATIIRAEMELRLVKEIPRKR